MKAEFIGHVVVYNMPFDRYVVKDGQYRHNVAVSVAGGMDIARGDGDTDHETMVSIIAAVLEEEQRRGFR